MSLRERDNEKSIDRVDREIIEELVREGNVPDNSGAHAQNILGDQRVGASGREYGKTIPQTVSRVSPSGGQLDAAGAGPSSPLAQIKFDQDRLKSQSSKAKDQVLTQIEMHALELDLARIHAEHAHRTEIRRASDRYRLAVEAAEKLYEERVAPLADILDTL